MPIPSNMIALILDDIRSAHNVGSIFRSADGCGVVHIYVAGYTPFPLMPNDPRLPHIGTRLHYQISKTALGAESSVSFSTHKTVEAAIAQARDDGYQIVALEQHSTSKTLMAFTPYSKTAILVGNETQGISIDTLKLVDTIVEIPMKGSKESFNVAVSTGIALYEIGLRHDA